MRQFINSRKKNGIGNVMTTHYFLQYLTIDVNIII